MLVEGLVVAAVAVDLPPTRVAAVVVLVVAAVVGVHSYRALLAARSLLGTP